MENKRQSNDSDLSSFDSWIRREAVRPPADLLQRVRNRLGEAADPADELIDELMRPDPTLRNEFMLARVRRQLAQPAAETTETRFWLRWLPPIAAAATLAFAFFSFQAQAPREWNAGTTSPDRLTALSEEGLFDERTTEIFALASNLQGETDFSKLESVEDLAFLFD